MKYCKKCDVSKNENEFGKDKNTKDGLNFYCKACIRIRSDKQRKNNPEYVKEYARKYRKENRDLLREKSKEYFHKDREKRLQQGKEYYICHANEIAKRRKIKRSTQEARLKESERQKEWRANNPNLYRSYIRKWQKKNKERCAAHQRVHRAIEDGLLIRNLACQKCYKLCKTEAHHEDYSKPLDVIWLCRKCHASLLEVIEV